ncbi:MAG TPA: cupin domain-containing protein [Eubacteriaceae bacterium]|nr:cupin domain-containing protein [Eubacteriaceae bacterium]
MNIIKMKEVEGKINKRGVEAKQLISHDDTRVMNLNLKPGDEVPAHSVPVEVFFYVVDGKGTIQIGEEKAAVEATDIVLCPKNTKMALFADQDSNFSVLNVKTPNIK